MIQKTYFANKNIRFWKMSNSCLPEKKAWPQNFGMYSQCCKFTSLPRTSECSCELFFCLVHSILPSSWMVLDPGLWNSPKKIKPDREFWEKYEESNYSVTIFMFYFSKGQRWVSLWFSKEPPFKLRKWSLVFQDQQKGRKTPNLN